VLSQDSEIDFFVKKYMKVYGTNNVRGGTYTSCELTKEEHYFVEREHTTNLEHMKSLCDVYTNMRNEYTDADIWTIDKIRQEIVSIKIQQSQYEKEVNMLQQLSISCGIPTNKIFLADLKWLLNQCSKYINIPNTKGKLETTNREMTVKYKQILNKMKALYKIVQDHINIDVKYEPQIHLYAPETAFDIFILHNHSNINWEDHVKVIIRLIEYNEYMFYSVMNRIDEYTFDVSTYPPNFKEITQYKLNYLQLHIDSRINDSRGIRQDNSCLS